MLQGTANISDFERGAPSLADFETEALVLPRASVLQVLYEIDSDDMCALLPPALHPTLPPVVNWSFYRFPDTPWGEVNLAQTRLQCRSGLRPRGLLLNAAIDNEAAGAALASRFGFRSERAEVSLRIGYDEVRGQVEFDGDLVLDLGARDPQPLGATTVQFVSNVHPAQTPAGFRLVQVDFQHVVERAEACQPVLDEFDAEAWGDERIEPSYPISAAYCLADVTLPKLRFVCRPDVMAFEGTEPI
ncbi:acetoacetate decarboxylase family protein [Myxococcota bacterium]|nr:acetoacetate decarboxylase family protein [Myxococcota bacterium]